MKLLLSETVLEFCRLHQSLKSEEDIIIMLESSPCYPSLFCVYQTINFAGIPIKIVKYTKEDLKKCKSYFMLHLRNGRNDYLLIAKNKCTRFISIYNLSKKSWEDRLLEPILQTWDGVVIVAQVNSSKCKNRQFLRQTYTILFFLLLVAFGGYFILSFPITIIIFGGLLCFGLLWVRQNGKRFRWQEKICNINSSFSCDKVSQTKYGKFLGFRLSELGLSYFFSQLQIVFFAMVFGIPINERIFFLSALICLPIAIYSLYAQWKIGKLCIFCIAGLIVVLIEAVLFFNSLEYDYRILGGILLLYVLNLQILYSIQQNKKLKQSYIDSRINELKIKRKKEFYESLHLPVVQVMNDEQNSRFFLGNNKYPKLIIVLSTTCAHCKETVREVFHENLMEKYNIEFIFHATKQNFAWYCIISEAYHRDLQKFRTMLLEWANNKDDSCSLKITSSEKIDLIKINEFITENGIHEFPTLILNGKIISPYYSIFDLKYI